MKLEHYINLAFNEGVEKVSVTVAPGKCNFIEFLLALGFEHDFAEHSPPPPNDKDKFSTRINKITYSLYSDDRRKY